MKKKVAIVVLAVLLMVLVLPGCVSRTELDECKALAAEQATQIEKQAVQINELKEEADRQKKEIISLNSTVTTKDARIAELEAEKAELEAEIECLKRLAPKTPKEAVGTVTMKKLREMLREYFPKAVKCSGAFSRGPYSLVSLETLKNFLADDLTDVCPRCPESKYDVCDELAFRLKDHWIKAGFPPMSLGLAKKERFTHFGTQLYWRNIFITREHGELVIYEVNAHTDQIIKIEEPDLETHRVVIQDRM